MLFHLDHPLSGSGMTAYFSGADAEAAVCGAASGSFVGVASAADAGAGGAASVLVVEARRVVSLWDLCDFARPFAENALPLYEP
jgi:hypothetical protein